MALRLEVPAQFLAPPRPRSGNAGHPGVLPHRVGLCHPTISGKNQARLANGVLSVSTPQYPTAPLQRISVRCLATTGGAPAKSRQEEWEKARNVLMKQVRSVTPAEAVKLVEEGKYRFLDVRPEAEFAEVRPQGAVNAQMYRLIKNWSARDVARRVGFAFFGVFNGTEDNPEFLAEVERVAKKDDGLIVACLMGGTVKPSTNFPQGKESRSLNAAYVLASNGYTNVLHLDGGLATYFREDHPVDYSE